MQLFEICLKLQLILIETIALLIIPRRNETQIEMANFLDTILRNVSLNADEGYMEISRVLDFELRLSCDPEAIAKGSDFSCNATVGKMEVVFFFFRREIVCMFDSNALNTRFHEYFYHAVQSQNYCNCHHSETRVINFFFVAMLPTLTIRIQYRDKIQLYELSFGIAGKMTHAGSFTLKNAWCYRTDHLAIPIKSQNRVGDDVLHLIYLNINAKLES